ncbi:MAG: PPC domain-containing protein, partial [Acidimicrobiales bacterium]
PPTLLRQASAEELELDQGTYDRLRGAAGDDDAVASFTVPAGRFGVVLAESLVGPEGAVTYTSSVPLSSFPDADNGVPLTIGTRHVGALDTFETLDTFTVDLAQGQALDVYLGAVAGDMAYWIYPVGGEADEANMVDDSNEGLYGLDAHETFTAPAAGAYIIEVSTYETISVGYVLDVQAG